MKLEQKQFYILVCNLIEPSKTPSFRLTDYMLTMNFSHHGQFL